MTPVRPSARLTDAERETLKALASQVAAEGHDVVDGWESNLLQRRYDAIHSALRLDDAQAQASEWCCEEHPWLDWPHGGCAGPGCPIASRPALVELKIRLLTQALTERDKLAGEAALKVIELTDAQAAREGQTCETVTIGLNGQDQIIGVFATREHALKNTRYVIELAVQREPREAKA